MESKSLEQLIELHNASLSEGWNRGDHKVFWAWTVVICVGTYVLATDDEYTRDIAMFSAGAICAASLAILYHLINKRVARRIEFAREELARLRADRANEQESSKESAPQ